MDASTVAVSCWAGLRSDCSYRSVLMSLSDVSCRASLISTSTSELTPHQREMEVRTEADRCSSVPVLLTLRGRGTISGLALAGSYTEQQSTAAQTSPLLLLREPTATLHPTDTHPQLQTQGGALRLHRSVSWQKPNHSLPVCICTETSGDPAADVL